MRSAKKRSEPASAAGTERPESSQPWLHQKGAEIQEFGSVRQFPLGLSRDARMYSCQRHDAAKRTAELGDDGTDDLLVSDVVRTGELQAWFLAEHLVDTPLVHS